MRTGPGRPYCHLPCRAGAHLQQIASQAGLASVYQKQVVIECLDKALRYRDLFHLHLQWQLSLGAPHLDARHETTHLVLPATSWEPSVHLC